jgi:hypothetical protein
MSIQEAARKLVGAERRADRLQEIGKWLIFGKDADETAALSSLQPH